MLISLCMIVKDEEDVIARCLESVGDAVDEIIVLDTGSTDSTVEIASRFTNHIFTYSWKADFADARNEAASHAKGKWILVLDADEYFANGDAHKLRSFLEEHPINQNQIVTLEIISFLGNQQEDGFLSSGRVSRIYPNRVGIHYDRPIHEQLVSDRTSQLHFISAPVSVYHTGYLKDVIKIKSKSERNAELFQKIKQQSGFSAYDYFSLGNEFGVQGNFEKAAYYYEKAIRSVKSETVGWYPKCVIMIIQCYLKLNRVSTSYEWIESKLIKWKNYPDYHYLKAKVLVHWGLLKAGEEEFLEALRLAEIRAQAERVFWLESADFATTFPMQGLVRLYERTGRYEKAVYYQTKLLKQNIYDSITLNGLLSTLLFFEEVPQIIQIMNQIYTESDIKHQYFLFRASLSVKSAELARHYQSQLALSDQILDSRDLLPYYFLIKDKSSYSAIRSNSINELSKEAFVIDSIANAIWQFDTPLHSANVEWTQLKDSLQMILSMESDREEILENYFNLLLLILKTSYGFQEYELFDRLIHYYSDHRIINEMANFFYSIQNEKIALDYYSILLENDVLHETGYENLAHYHFKHMYNIDGLAFLERVIEINPGKIQSYALYLEQSLDPEKKKQYQKKLLSQLSAAKKIPAFLPLLT